LLCSGGLGILDQRGLEELGRRLSATVRGTDLAIRLGGDEFVVLAEERPSLADAESGMRELVARLRGCMDEPFVPPDGRALRLRASIGWAIDHGRDDTAGAMLHRPMSPCTPTKLRPARPPDPLPSYTRRQNSTRPSGRLRRS